jgi:hypothetical protein
MSEQIDSNLSSLADEYGEIKAILADMVVRQGAIKKIFEEAGVDSLEGDIFRLVVSHVDDSTGRDWKKIALSYKPSKRVLEHPANQKVTQTAHVRVNVYARTGVES